MSNITENDVVCRFYFMFSISYYYFDIRYDLIYRGIRCFLNGKPQSFHCFKIWFNDNLDH